ncbi:MAG: hypothetical protein QF437_18695, partial [Planctomycetota bacterium]|nr:hypothetical protein [Planctomycetota bacterium]
MSKDKTKTKNSRQKKLRFGHSSSLAPTLVNLPPKAAIIANPVSGGGRGRKMAEKARRYIQ